MEPEERPTIIQRLQVLSQYYQSLSIPARLLASAIISAVGGAGLGFISEYASYSYAVYYGFRPPLEGVPFLRLTVTATTVFILLGGMFAFLAVSYSGKYILRQVHFALRFNRIYFRFLNKILGVQFNSSVDLDFLLQLFKNIRLRNAIIISIIIGLIAALVPIGLIDFEEKFPWSKDTILISMVLLCTALFFVTSLSILLIWNDKLIFWFSIVAVVVVLVVGPFLLMNINIFGAYLRFLGYGGGVEITVVLKQNTGTHEYIGGLMLRSISSLFLYDDNNHRMLEIPFNNVLSIYHEARSLHTIPYKTPLLKNKSVRQTPQVGPMEN